MIKVGGQLNIFYLNKSYQQRDKYNFMEEQYCIKTCYYTIWLTTGCFYDFYYFILLMPLIDGIDKTLNA